MQQFMPMLGLATLERTVSNYQSMEFRALGARANLHSGGTRRGHRATNVSTTVFIRLWPWVSPAVPQHNRNCARADVGSVKYCLLGQSIMNRIKELALITISFHYSNGRLTCERVGSLHDTAPVKTKLIPFFAGVEGLGD